MINNKYNNQNPDTPKSHEAAIAADDKRTIAAMHRGAAKIIDGVWREGRSDFDARASRLREIYEESQRLEFGKALDRHRQGRLTSDELFEYCKAILNEDNPDAMPYSVRVARMAQQAGAAQAGFSDEMVRLSWRFDREAEAIEDEILSQS